MFVPSVLPPRTYIDRAPDRSVENPDDQADDGDFDYSYRRRFHPRDADFDSNILRSRLHRPVYKMHHPHGVHCGHVRRKSSHRGRDRGDQTTRKMRLRDHASASNLCDRDRVRRRDPHMSHHGRDRVRARHASTRSTHTTFLLLHHVPTCYTTSNLVYTTMIFLRGRGRDRGRDHDRDPDRDRDRDHMNFHDYGCHAEMSLHDTSRGRDHDRHAHGRVPRDRNHDRGRVRDFLRKKSSAPVKRGFFRRHDARALPLRESGHRDRVSDHRHRRESVHTPRNRDRDVGHESRRGLSYLLRVPTLRLTAACLCRYRAAPSRARWPLP
mmetsp:Transcript_18933/g.31057  ORF Transcript_18933/g.31057 Transcript_18933/m.31057 type:complete len:324 (+) Transcript_18933:573-1544(+)